MEDVDFAHGVGFVSIESAEGQREYAPEEKRTTGI
jgi:hypothetical protein